jgi:signal transduction histidine kinase
MSALSLLLVVALGAALQLRRNLDRQAAVRSQLEEKLRHAQRLESIGRLAGGVAHDFNNYLTVILGHAALLETPRTERETQSSIAAIRDVGERAAALTRQLLAFSRKQVLRPRLSDDNTLISDARTTLLPLIGAHVEIELRLSAIDAVEIDPDQFFQVLVNLSVNARDAMPDGGTLTVTTRMVDLAAAPPAGGDGLRPGRYVCVSVADTGIGMDEATRKHAFDPFFTTKEPGRGTGLGLAVVFGIVAQSNGHVEVQSSVGKGTTFEIYLPVAGTALSPEDLSAPVAARAPQPSHRV